jgi:16S rRNA (cytosine1402-N4)-methyltransferase
MTGLVVEIFRPLQAGVIVDATFGGGGHTRALLEAMPDIRVVAVDRDGDAASQAVPLADRVVFYQQDFRKLEAVLGEEGLDEIDGILFDLGVSSHQLDVGDRGFSYRRSGPLDMRMGPDAALTADEVVNTWDERSLAGVIRRYGEERWAGRIARAIVTARPIADTTGLAEVVSRAVPAPARRSGHPARRTFQALRIVVNDELGALAEGLDAALGFLRPGGRIVVISYHSLEDRVVKRRFDSGARGCICPPDLPVCGCGKSAELRLLTRRPARPEASEVACNPRARSARLRAAEVIAA